MFCKIIVKRVISFFFVMLCIGFFLGCRTFTFDRRDPYPNKRIVNFANGRAYYFQNKSSDTLIILMEGSGWSSSLGVRENDTWISVQYGAQFIQELNNDFSFLILEKLQRLPGMVHYWDMDDRRNYTAENLLVGYVDGINEFLSMYQYTSIVMIGVSEGAALLPIVYKNIYNKENIVAMVSISFGGLSMYESSRILSTRNNLPQGWFEMYFSLVQIFSPLNQNIFDCYERTFYNHTLRWFNSFMHLRPFEYYKKIDIPVLFVHGKADFNVPIESTKYIQENLYYKPFEFKFYHWDHQPRNANDMIDFRRDIAGWIRNVLN